VSVNRPTRFAFIDAIKGLAILGVLFIHMGFASRFDAATLGKVQLLQSLFAWCVLAFFFASGFLHRSSGHLGEDLKPFIAKRAWRLLVPCAAFSWSYKVLLFAAHRAGFMSSGTLPSLATPADVLTTILTPAAPQFYFLVHLFVIAVAVQFVMRIPALGSRAAQWLLAAAILQSYWLLPLDKPHGEALTHLPLYTAAYLLGLQTARLDRESDLLSLARDPFFLLFAASVAAISFSRPQILHLCVPLLLFASTRIMPAVADSPLHFLGRHSGAIYAWHTPIVMPALSTLLTRLPFTGWPLILAMCAATLALTLLLDSLLRRFDKAGIFRL